MWAWIKLLLGPGCPALDHELRNESDHLSQQRDSTLVVLHVADSTPDDGFGQQIQGDDQAQVLGPVHMSRPQQQAEADHEADPEDLAADQPGAHLPLHVLTELAPVAAEGDGPAPVEQDRHLVDTSPDRQLEDQAVDQQGVLRPTFADEPDSVCHLAVEDERDEDPDQQQAVRVASQLDRIRVPGVQVCLSGRENQCSLHGRILQVSAVPRTRGVLVPGHLRADVRGVVVGCGVIDTRTGCFTSAHKNTSSCEHLIPQLLICQIVDFWGI